MTHYYNNPLDLELRIDQLFCLYNLYNDPDISFHLKMWCLFLRNVLYNNVVYSELIGGSLILPWRCTDYYPIEIIQSFIWKPVYGRCSDELLAYMDFWYEQYFHNPLIEFKQTDTMGIGVFAKHTGDLSFQSSGLLGLLEYITEEKYNQLLYTEHHWSLYKYNMSWDTIAYTIVYGTACLLNDHTNSNVIFHVKNSIPIKGHFK